MGTVLTLVRYSNQQNKNIDDYQCWASWKIPDFFSKERSWNSFFQSVDDYRIDAVGKDWQVAQTTLFNERSAGPIVTPSSGRDSNKVSAVGDAYALINLAKNSSRDGQSAANDPLLRDQIMQMMIRQAASKQGPAAQKLKTCVNTPCAFPCRLSWRCPKFVRIAPPMPVKFSTIYSANVFSAWPNQNKKELNTA